MRVLSGALFEGCFVLGLLLVAALITLLRHSVWRFVRIYPAHHPRRRLQPRGTTQKTGFSSGHRGLVLRRR
jgi:hypothetical protein